MQSPILSILPVNMATSIGVFRSTIVNKIMNIDDSLLHMRFPRAR